ncbi:GIY-YIG nuclease family protein [Streptomyces gamaensis]|uniref:GIY-YIG nuclease family protein n=1 Tax=Streptomyces gamaensis TaxID=1763542 RepID=A0ABW0YUW2_9ACTN
MSASQSHGKSCGCTRDQSRAHVEMLRRWMPGPKVYVLGGQHPGQVKIGFTERPVADRFAEIQNMSPVTLHLLAQFKGGRDLEAALHRRFADRRIGGEWFDFSGLHPVAEIMKAVVGLDRTGLSPQSPSPHRNTTRPTRKPKGR